MFLKYTFKLFKHLNKYNKKATNPFLNLKKDLKFDYSKTLHEKTYIWVEDNKD